MKVPRYSLDKSDNEGLYILTGSTVVDESKIKHLVLLNKKIKNEAYEFGINLNFF